MVVDKNMILVSGGMFLMGDDRGDFDEHCRPVHFVNISDFYICDHLVTQEEWVYYMRDNPSNFQDESLPLERVSWAKVIDYCNIRSLHEGFSPCYVKKDHLVICEFMADGYRLPTESEWEFAARGGRQTDKFKFSGANVLDDVGWYKGNSNDSTHRPALKKPNELKIFDMSGNLWEWCWDWYSEYSSNTEQDPIGPGKGKERICRGGSWMDFDYDCTVFMRSRRNPIFPQIDVGFRVVRSSKR